MKFLLLFAIVVGATSCEILRDPDVSLADVNSDILTDVGSEKDGAQRDVQSNTDTSDSDANDMTDGGVDTPPDLSGCGDAIACVPNETADCGGLGEFGSGTATCNDNCEWETSTCDACSFFIAINGNDSNDGLTPQTAWATPLPLEDYPRTGVDPGNVFCFERGGEFYLNKEISMALTGSAVDPIRFTSWGTGEDAILTGGAELSPISVGGGRYRAAVGQQRVSRIWIDGVPLDPASDATLADGGFFFDETTNTVDFLASSMPTVTIAAGSDGFRQKGLGAIVGLSFDNLTFRYFNDPIVVRDIDGPVSDFTIRDCRIERSRYGVNIRPENSDISNIIIERNEFIGGDDGMRLSGPGTTGSNIVFRNNRVADLIATLSAWPTAVLVQSGNDVLIESNELIGPVPGAVLQSDAKGTGINIELFNDNVSNVRIIGNRVDGFKHGVSTRQLGTGVLTGVHVLNNIIYSGWQGFRIGHNDANDDSKYFHNTVFLVRQFGELEGVSVGTGIEIANNIGMMPDASNRRFLDIASVADDLKCDNNLVSYGNVRIAGVETTFVEWQALGFDLLTVTDPTFQFIAANPLINEDFRTLSTDAVGKGRVVNVAEDFGGNARNEAAPTIGAWE